MKDMSKDDQKLSRQGMRALFFEAIYSLVRLEFLTSDAFVVGKAKFFSGEIISLLSEYEIYANVGNSKDNNVAQYNSLNGIRLERVIMGLEYIQHFNAIPATPLLETFLSLLKLQRAIKQYQQPPKPNNRKIDGNGVQKEKFKPDKKNAKPDLLSENKKRILEFIIQSQEVRPKDVVSKFNSLTKRTVKRNLQELLKAGFLTKNNRDHAVLYTAVK